MDLQGFWSFFVKCTRCRLTTFSETQYVEKIFLKTFYEGEKNFWIYITFHCYAYYDN